MEPEHEPELKTSPVSQTTLVRVNTRIKSRPRTPQLTSLLKGDTRPETTIGNPIAETALAEPFTEAELRETWVAYAEQRKKFQAEYQLLTQPYRLDNNVIVVELISPVHETMLNSIKSELTGYLREQLRNNTLQVTGQLPSEGNEKKIIYTNREKFDFLAEKNPMLKELRDRLGLDTDF